MEYIFFIACLILLIWLLSYGIASLDALPGRLQNKCDKEGKPDDPRQINRPGHLGNVLRIRLTNNGSFIDRCELTDVLYELNWDSPRAARGFGARRKPDAISLPKFIVLYIHGWKHSASNNDTDLLNFTKAISRLNQVNATDKQVLGVYVGWNATSKAPFFDRFPLNNLTFWSRQRVADRIAQSGVITKILSSISAVLSDGDRSDENQFIAIGHSFGARILFSGASQPLIYDTQRAHPGCPGEVYKMIHGIANAVILLNPAFEAARYTALDAITRIEEKFADNQLPLLLAISSKGDWATKTAFPIGQLVGSYKSETERTTLGNYSKYQTHSLQIANSEISDASGLNDLSENFAAGGLRLTRDRASGNDCGRTAGSEPRIVQLRNPFLIASTTPKIIRDHNDIWNERFAEWLFAYINELGNRRRPRLLDDAKGISPDGAGAQATTA